MVKTLSEAFGAFVRSIVREELLALVHGSDYERHLKAHVAMANHVATGPLAMANRIPADELTQGEMRARLRGLGTSKLWTAERIESFRLRVGMNRVQFGKAVGFSTWTVFMHEHGKVKPSEQGEAKYNAYLAKAWKAKR